MSLLVKNMYVQRCYIEASSFITVKNLGPAVEYGPCQDLMGKAHLENRLQKPVTKTPGCSDSWKTWSLKNKENVPSETDF